MFTALILHKKHSNVERGVISSTQKQTYDMTERSTLPS